MQVQSTADRLYFTTARLIGLSGDRVRVGTGFFYVVRVRALDNPEQLGEVAFLVTNKHIVEGGKDRLTVGMIKNSPDDLPALGEASVVNLSPDCGWTFHPEKPVDVAVLPFNDVEQMLQTTGQAPYYAGVPALLAPSEETLRLRMNSIEEVVFVGYPSAIHDTKNLTPIIRRGITATPPEVDYCGQPAFLVDAAVFPGSSGSPVFILDRGTWQGRDGNVNIGHRTLILGIVAAVHSRTIEAEVRELPATTKAKTGISLEDPLNLGIVYKTTAIDECVDIALNRAGLERHPEQRARETGEEAPESAAA